MDSQKFAEYLEKVKNGEFTMNRAYRDAQRNHGFDGSFANFADTVKSYDGWDNADGEPEKTDVKIVVEKKSNALMWGAVLVGVIALLYYSGKKQNV